MEKLKMENKEVKEEVKESKNLNLVKRLNLSYIDFLVELKEKKVIVDKSNKENIINIYGRIVKLRFNNIGRIDFRVKRSELNKELMGVLESRNMSFKEFNKLSEKVVSLRKKNINYLEVVNN